MLGCPHLLPGVSRQAKHHPHLEETTHDAWTSRPSRPCTEWKGANSIGSQLGLGRADTERGVDAALPALLTKLKGSADDSVAGPVLVSAISSEHNGGLLDSLGDFFGGGHAGLASKALGLAFGKDADTHDAGPVAAIAKSAGLGGSQTKGLLGMLAPLVFGALGKLGGGSLSSGMLSNLLGGALGQLGGGTSAVKLLGGLAGASPDDDAKGVLGGLGGKAVAGAAAGAAVLAGAAGAAKGVAGSLGDKIPDVKVPDVKAAATKTVGAATGAATRTAGAAVGVATGAAVAAKGMGGKKRPAWMWLLPLLLVAALAGLLLSKCGDDNDKDDKGAAATTEVTADTAVVTEVLTTEAAPVSEAAVAVTEAAVATEAAAPVTDAAVATEAGAPVTDAAVAAEAAAPGTEVAAPATTIAAVVTNAAGDATPEDLTVYFDTSKSNIRGDQESKIANAVAALKGLAQGSKVNVVGHADNRGDAAKNQALSLARVNSVVDAIKAGLGADASKIEFAASAKGDTEPVGDLAKSRRVTVEIQK